MSDSYPGEHDAIIDNEKGSNERPSKRDGCFTKNPLHNNIDQLSHAIS